MQQWGPHHQYPRHPPQWPGYHQQRPPPKRSNATAWGCAVFAGLFIAMVVVVKVLASLERSRKETTSTSDDKAEKFALAKEIAGIFDGDCTSKEVDKSCRDLTCWSCKTSEGRVTFARHKQTTAAARATIVSSSLKPRTLGYGSQLCGGAYLITEGPLDGYVLIEQEGQLHIATPQYFLPSVGSGFSKETRECVIARTLRQR